MKVYRDLIPVDEVPNSRRRPGEFFSRLVAVNVSSDGTNVEPIYMPLMRIQRGEGTITIWINNFERPLYMIFLRRRWPMIQFFRYDWLTLDEYDTEVHRP